MTDLLSVDGFFAALGISLIAAILFSWLRTERFIKSATRAKGVVVDLSKDSGIGDTGVTYAPVFQFQTPDDRTWTVISSNGSMPAGFKIGDHVSVFYDPADPSKARINTVLQLWGTTVVLGLVGLGFLTFGVAKLLTRN